MKTALFVLAFLFSICLQAAPQTVQNFKVDSETGLIHAGLAGGKIWQYQADTYWAQVHWTDLTFSVYTSSTTLVDFSNSGFQSKKTHHGQAVVETSSVPRLTVKNMPAGRRWRVTVAASMNCGDWVQDNTDSAVCEWAVYDGTTTKQLHWTRVGDRETGYHDPAMFGGGTGVAEVYFEYTDAQPTRTFSIQGRGGGATTAGRAYLSFPNYAGNNYDVSITLTAE